MTRFDSTAASSAELDERAERWGGQPRTYPFETFRDLQEDRTDKDWIIDDVFGFKELSVVYGAPGDGKSVLIADAACHVAAGRPWFGKPVAQAAVVYFAAERGALVKRRMIAWARKHGVSDLPLAVIDQSLDLVGSDEDANRLVRTLYNLPFDDDEPWWIIIDTKARAMGGGDENAARDMNALVANCGLIQRKTGCHVTVIDHVPHHDKGRMRGHRALLGAADATFRVSKQNGTRLFEVDKVNDGPDDIRFAFTLESIVLSTDEETGKETTAPVVVPAEHSHASIESQSRKMSDRQRNALDALAESVLTNGKAAPSSFGLPPGTIAVPLPLWRDELLRRAVIRTDSKNPRADFTRLRESLTARYLIGVRDDLVWSAA